MIPAAEARERAAAMASLYLEGETLAQVGFRYGLTRERVRQILRKHTEVTRKDGGSAVRAERLALIRDQKRDAKALAKWGCTYAQYLVLRHMNKPVGAFRHQSTSAHSRGIGWELNLWQWWTIWQDSGHWAERGPGQGYVMCRKGDRGPYAVGNVFIAQARENSSEGQNGRRTHTGMPMGVTPTKSGRFMVKRMLMGKLVHLGTHDTPDLAYAAYLRASPQQQVAA